MPDLASTDWLVLLLYVLGSIGIGVSMRSTVKSSADYFQAGRAMRTAVCALALIIAGLGAPEVLGLGAVGAAFGFRTAFYFVLGSIPALLVVAYFLVPLYYRSGAQSLPGYLGLRFDQRTRTLSAVMFTLMSLLSAGIALFIVARIFQALHILDRLFFAYGWPREGIFLICILLAAVPVLFYVVIAGLRGTIISQVVQFVLLVAGFLPVVWTALNNAGAQNVLNDLNASLTPLASTTTRTSVAVAALVFGFVLGASRWATDFRVLQTALAAKSADSARRATVFASAAWVVVPFLFVLPGAIALSLPTPQSKTIIRNENGAIYHEITIVPREISEGRGIVPAVIDPATNNPHLDSPGHTQLDYGMATPNLLTHFASTGLLGLAIAALLASLMSGVASAAIATSTVFVHDLYHPLRGDSINDAKLILSGRWASAAAILISVATAFAIAHFSPQAHGTVISTWLAIALTVYALLQAPQLATFVLGAFTRRIGGTAAFAGLVAGIISALLHHGLTLPVDASPGTLGGWLTPFHRYHGLASQTFFTVISGFMANLCVASLVSFLTPAPDEANIKSLVYSSTPAKPARKSAGKRAR